MRYLFSKAFSFSLLHLLQLLLLGLFASTNYNQKVLISASFLASSNCSNNKNKIDTKLFVFDFFKQRAEEGLDQLTNIADSASKGKLGEGLMNAATYTQQTNQVRKPKNKQSLF